ncbi:MAG TPA: thiamine phosphate synthase [Pyrinomonadaceae bacterium]|nr:thiamine phosphate synthase [Pyrinomonadaceae bacterium]
MNNVLPKIYPITDTRISGLSHLEQVKRLIAGGATLIQLREKHLSPAEFCEDASAVIAYARERSVKIIINDRVDIAAALNADGIHLGQDDLPPAAARKLLGEDAIIGFSTHTVEQVREALLLPVDYIAYGPIFDTRTKQNPDATVGLSALEDVREIIGDRPLVAIGGIHSDNYRSVLAARADSAAIISAILSDPDQIESKMRSFNNIYTS